MLRTILWFTYFGISLVLQIPNMIKVNYLKKKLPQSELLSIVNKITSNWSYKLLKHGNMKIHVTGEEFIPKERAVLFVSNHQSYNDINVILAYINKDKGFIAKEELSKVPFINYWMKNLNCVFMDRSDLKKSGKAIIDGINILKSGYSMVIFPEGTRSKSTKMSEFKSASLKLATKAKVPIVPITLDGTYKTYEEHNRICSTDVYVTIHQPIETMNLNNNELEEVNKKIVETIKSGFKIKLT